MWGYCSYRRLSKFDRKWILGKIKQKASQPCTPKPLVFIKSGQRFVKYEEPKGILAVHVWVPLPPPPYIRVIDWRAKDELR